jgi:type III secretory pathway component EscU
MSNEIREESYPVAKSVLEFLLYYIPLVIIVLILEFGVLKIPYSFELMRNTVWLVMIIGVPALMFLVWIIKDFKYILSDEFDKEVEEYKLLQDMLDIEKRFKIKNNREEKEVLKLVELEKELGIKANSEEELLKLAKEKGLIS